MAYKKIEVFFSMIKFEHTIFALPFAYLGAFWPSIVKNSNYGLPSFMQLFWITLVMVGGRTFAMAANRLIDRRIDAKNPRTKERALPKKLLSLPEILTYIGVALAIFLVAVYQLSPLAKKLWPIALFSFVFYSYLKRFFPLANLGLGFCLSLAPLGAWIAVTNSVSLPILLASLGVFAWASGFDIVYSCQDYEFDRKNKLYSIPVCVGIKNALCTTKYLHLFAILFFTAAGYYSNMGFIYYLGITLAAILLIYENVIVKPEDFSRVNEAFFTVNGFFSVIITVFALTEILIKQL